MRRPFRPLVRVIDVTKTPAQVMTVTQPGVTDLQVAGQDTDGSEVEGMRADWDLSNFQTCSQWNNV